MMLSAVSMSRQDGINLVLVQIEEKNVNLSCFFILCGPFFSISNFKKKFLFLN